MITFEDDELVNLGSVVESFEIQDDDGSNYSVFKKQNVGSESLLIKLINERFARNNETPLSTMEKTFIDDINNNVDRYLAVYPATSCAHLKQLIINAAKYLGPNGNFNWIDTSQLKSLSQAFKGMAKFNGDITKWDTSNIENMLGTFDGASSFDRDLSGWDVSKVKYISSTSFKGCKPALLRCFKEKKFPNKVTNFT